MVRQVTTVFAGAFGAYDYSATDVESSLNMISAPNLKAEFPDDLVKLTRRQWHRPDGAFQ